MDNAATYQLQYPYADAHGLAANISTMWESYDSARSKWMAGCEEVMRYIMATDTTTTSNSALPWKNKTTLPKLTQIRDNLHANYKSAIFPREEWLIWDGFDDDAVKTERKTKQEAYMRTKLDQCGFEEEIDKQLLDYIDCGNAFAIVEHVQDAYISEKSGEEVVRYVGPRARRISPYDIVFNPVAENFYRTPKIVRRLVTMADLLDMVEKNPEQYDATAIQKMRNLRMEMAAAISRGDKIKDATLNVSGFTSMQMYFQSGYVELLTFYGDIYDPFNDRFLKNYEITVADRCYIINEKQNPHWLGRIPIHHVGWRRRPDSLWAMGPLDNLVGMQYRMDHLENLKADAMDVTVYPVLKIKGHVEEFDYGPGERIYIHDDGDVDFMHPDNAMLSVDNQIRDLEARMELYAGAPREAMGVRTPGEKTAFEVEQLQNAAGRIFQLKTEEFEKYMERIINDMLESARRNLMATDVAKYVDEENGVAEFLEITKADLEAKGRLIPVGARHYAERARMVQELNAFMGSPVGQDPGVKVHLSGYQIALLIENMLSLRKFKVVGKNVRIAEDFETKRLMQVANEQGAVESGMPVENVDPENESYGPGVPPGVGSELVNQ